MSVKFSNNGHSTLAASITTSDTSITVASGHGARFPSLSSGEYFYATLIDSSNNLEIVKCTARSSDVLTVTRAQESTTARAYAIGDRIELRMTSASIADATNIDNTVPDQSSHSGKFLTTDGTNVSWATAGTNASDLSSGTVGRDRLPAGSILQIVSTTDNTRRKYNSVSSGTWLGNYNNIDTSITPLSSSSKLMFFVCIHYGVSDATSTSSVFWRIKEGGTVHTVLNGDSGQTYPSFSQDRWSHSGSSQQYDTKRAVINGIQISNSTTNARTYSIEFRVQNSGKDVAVNRDGSDASDSSQGSHSPTLASNMTIVEVQT